MASFGEGFANALNAQMGINQRRAAAAKQQKMEEQRLAQQQKKAQQDMLKWEIGRYDSGVKDIMEIMKGQSQEDALKFWDKNKALFERYNFVVKQLPSGGGDPGQKAYNFAMSRPTQAEMDQKVVKEGQLKGKAALMEALVKSSAVPPSERQSAIAKSLGITESDAFFRSLQALKDPNIADGDRKLILERINRLTKPFQININPQFDRDGNLVDGGTSPTAGTGTEASTALSSKQQLPGTSLDDIRAQLSAIRTGKNLVDKVQQSIASTPSKFGAVGSAGKVAREALAIAQDFANAPLKAIGMDLAATTKNLSELFEFEKSQGAEEDALSSIKPLSDGEVDVFEAILRYSVARALQPEGKLLASTVDASKEITSMRGFKSSKLVAEKMTTINRILSTAEADLVRRGQQGTSGRATTPSVPPTVTAPAMSDQELQQEINKLLGLQ